MEVKQGSGSVTNRATAGKVTAGTNDNRMIGVDNSIVYGVKIGLGSARCAGSGVFVT